MPNVFMVYSEPLHMVTHGQIRGGGPTGTVTNSGSLVHRDIGKVPPIFYHNYRKLIQNYGHHFHNCGKDDHNYGLNYHGQYISKLW